jgi:hypothetical protein
MWELNHTFFSVLHLAKVFFDSDVPDEAKKDLGAWELDEDNCYVLGLEATDWIFQDTAHYYNERQDIDTWLFSDPIIDKFCRLCQEYERSKGISEDENPYRRTMEQAIHENFRFDSYSYGYDWRLSLAERGRKCILLFTGEEFYSHESIPEGLLEVRAAFLELNQKLEAELLKETGIIPLSPVTAAQWKEAA